MWTFAYNDVGQPTAVGIPNGMTTEYGYDGQGRMTQIAHKDGGSVLDGFTYALDASGNITGTTHADNAEWAYEYDGRQRLTKAERYATDGSTLLKRFSYVYDDGDNMLTKEVYTPGSGTVATAFEYTIGNEMTKQSVGGVDTVFAYDDYGRMVSKYVAGVCSAAYTYRCGWSGAKPQRRQGLHRREAPRALCSVTSNFPGEGMVSYNYGADGKRRARVTSSETVKYRWDAGFNVINEEDSAGLLTRTYIGHTLAHFDGSGGPPYGPYKYYFHDNLGSSRVVRNEDKSSYASFEYTPYGEEYASSGSTANISHRFTGHAWDSTSQMYFAPFRYYMPGAGRWITQDPLGMIDGPNSYGYVGGEPVGRVDPEGSSSQGVANTQTMVGGGGGGNCGVETLRRSLLYFGSGIGLALYFFLRPAYHEVINPPGMGYDSEPGTVSVVARTTRRYTGTLGNGDHPGKSCATATCNDILSCISKEGVNLPENYNFLTNNCQDKTARTLKACCLAAGPYPDEDMRGLLCYSQRDTYFP